MRRGPAPTAARSGGSARSSAATSSPWSSTSPARPPPAVDELDGRVRLVRVSGGTGVHLAGTVTDPTGAVREAYGPGLHLVRPDGYRVAHRDAVPSDLGPLVDAALGAARVAAAA